jgi:hypothetical protein
MGRLLADVAGQRVYARRGGVYAGWRLVDADQADLALNWRTVAAVVARGLVERRPYNDDLDLIVLTGKGEDAMDAYAARQEGS